MSSAFILSIWLGVDFGMVVNFAVNPYLFCFEFSLYSVEAWIYDTFENKLDKTKEVNSGLSYKSPQGLLANLNPYSYWNPEAIKVCSICDRMLSNLMY